MYRPEPFLATLAVWPGDDGAGLASFYQAIATRKIQTAEAEYKAPYFDAVELKIGGTLEVYFVPVLGGTYDILCTITGHAAAGMTRGGGGGGGG